jgi:hypothetical protein
MNATLRIRAIDQYETNPIRRTAERPATLQFRSPREYVEHLRRQWIAETERYLNNPGSDSWSRAD